MGNVVPHPVLRRDSGSGLGHFCFELKIANFVQLETLFGPGFARSALADLMDRVSETLCGMALIEPRSDCGLEVYVRDPVAANLPAESADRTEWLQSLIVDLMLRPLTINGDVVHLVLVGSALVRERPRFGTIAVNAADELGPTVSEQSRSDHVMDMAVVSPALAAMGGYRSEIGSPIDVEVCWQPVRLAALHGTSAIVEGKFATIDANGKLEVGGRVIAAAERLGLVRLFDRYVASRAVAELLASPGAVALMVPVAVESFADTAFWEQLLTKLLRKGGIPRDLILEIRGPLSEASVLGVGETLAGLRQAGCRISIGQFGLGETSLRDASVFEPDIVSIDRHFISAGMPARLGSALPHLIGLGRALRAQVLVDGVDDALAATTAVEAGADLIKGAWCGPPRLSRCWASGHQAPRSARHKLAEVPVTPPRNSK